jgi:hypothetical protein
MLTGHSSVRALADSLLYLSSLLRDAPRPIDRHIDYFGEAAQGRIATVAARVPRPEHDSGRRPRWTISR